MVQPPTSKSPSRYAGITSLPSFVFPDDEARNREFSIPEARLSSSRSTGGYGALPGSAMDRLGALPPSNLAAVYSDGRRNYSSPEAMKAANPDMPAISNSAQGAFIRGQRSAPRADPGATADRIATAMGYSKNAHDLFGALAESAETGGKLAKTAFAPIGFILDAIGADSRFTASRQRGEPIDVAVVRGGGSVAGSVAGGAIGAPGGIIGGLAGAYGGEKFGEAAAEEYARRRRDWGH